jgi:HEAT repeat protein
MPKPQKLEAVQAQLNQIRAEPTAPGASTALSQILNGKHAVAIAQAARIIREAELRELLPDLVKTFERLIQNPSADPNCLGKKAIADALYRLEYSEEQPFLQGIHHVQMEPVWGGQVDTAPGLRNVCALGLVRMHYSDVMLELADLLADPELEARVGAVRAVAYSENPQAVPLLRLKLRLGDDPAVLSECFAALLRLAPASSLPLVTSFLSHANDQVQEMAALALGESHLAEALPSLKHWWQRSRNLELRQTGLLAIAMLRHDEAIDFLLSIIATANLQDYEAAMAALQIYQDDRDLANRIQQQIELRQGRSSP